MIHKYLIHNNNYLNAYIKGNFIISSIHIIDNFITPGKVQKFLILDMIIDFYIPLFRN